MRWNLHDLFLSAALPVYFRILQAAFYESFMDQIKQRSDFVYITLYPHMMSQAITQLNRQALNSGGAINGITEGLFFSYHTNNIQLILTAWYGAVWVT